MRLDMPVSNRCVLALGALLALGLTACSLDSPTEPQQVPGPPPGSAAPSATWEIEVVANPDAIRVDSGEFSWVTVEVRRASDGSKPPDGSTIVIRTSLGELDFAGSGVQERFAALEDGRVTFRLFPGEFGGLAVVQGRLEKSVGEAEVQIRDLNPHVLDVNPNSGPAGGGTIVEITGFDFDEPVQVFFGAQAAQLLEFIDSTRLRVRTPAFAGSFPEVDCLFCGVQGKRSVSVAVDVTVRNVATGREGTLSQAFTYVPVDTSCRVDLQPIQVDFTHTASETDPLRILFEGIVLEGDPPPNSWNWDFGDGSIGSGQTVAHTYAAADEYEVTLLARNSCTRDEDTVIKFVTVGP